LLTSLNSIIASPVRPGIVPLPPGKNGSRKTYHDSSKPKGNNLQKYTVISSG
jgi:hypothetical protein